MSRLHRLTCVLLIVLSLAVVDAWAAPEPLLARLDQNQVSAFTLNFGDFGGVASSQITKTEFLVDVDFDTGTAQFRFYDQEVMPLLLPGPCPGGACSTGNIRVTIQEAGLGSYDDLTGEFTSEDEYAIFFDGDLSAFDIESPFILPSASTGTISFQEGDSDRGTVSFEWRGEGFLPNPFMPGEFIAFSYVCDVQTTFAIPQPGDLDGNGDIDLVDFARLQNCFQGEGGLVGLTRCAIADWDRDGDVDLGDVQPLSNGATGPR